MANDSGKEATGATSQTSSYRKEESAARGQVIRTEFGRDRGDDVGADKESMMGRLSGDDGDLSASISSGKVPSI